ncbi:phosphatidylserine/phosphatidylglycerophosphate/c ardiolipin synthase family protein [Halomonas shantousis]
MRHDFWQDGNHFTLLPEGKRYWPEIFAALEGACESILFEQYLMESGQLADDMIDALVRAAQRGVKVYMLLDAFGTQGLADQDQERLTRAGVALQFFNPPFSGRLSAKLSRDHRKLLVVDQQVAFTGGFCVIDAFIEDWYDVALRIEGPVVEDWIRLFMQVWHSSLARGGQGAPGRALSEAVKPSFAERGMRGRVIWGRGQRYQAIRNSLLQRIASARRRIWIYTPYFLPSVSLRFRLMQAARRGVDVRLLVAGKKHDHPSVRYTGQHYYGRLLRAGVRIFEYQPKFTHAKFCLVDDWSTLGSCNFDHWSLRWNLEANQEVDDPRFAQEIASLFETNFTDSHEILRGHWARRPYHQRIRERLLGTINTGFSRLR